LHGASPPQALSLVDAIYQDDRYAGAFIYGIGISNSEHQKTAAASHAASLLHVF
jgi:hypothetical protein